MKFKLSQDVWVIVLLVIIASVILSFAGKAQSEGGEIIPIRTTFSARPTGLLGLYKALDRLGYPVVRHLRPLTDEPKDGVLFVISPIQPISASERNSLRKWVERGNLLIIVRSQDISEELGESRLRSSKPAIPSFLSNNVRDIYLDSKSSVEDLTWKFDPHHEKEDGPPLLTLFKVSSSNSVAFAECGRGGVVVVADSYLFSNKNISKGDNFQLILNAIEHQKGLRFKKVTFDEFHHGYGTDTGGLLSLLGVPAKLGLLQLFAAFLLLVFAVSRRFGRATPLQEGMRTRNEYLTSMSMLLRRAHATSAVAEQLREEFRRGIAVLLNLPPSADEATVRRALEIRHPQKVQKFEKLLSGPSGAAASESALLAIEIERDKFRKELVS